MLREDIQIALQQNGGHLKDVFDPLLVETFGLTLPERVTLAALIAADGEYDSALKRSGLRRPLFDSTLISLGTRGLIELPEQEHLSHFTWEGAERQFCLGIPDEDLTEEQPSINVGTRPLREQVIYLARLPRGLIKVYYFLFGEAPNYPMLGMLGKLLGTEQAAQLLLVNAHRPPAGLLQELIPIAKARAGRTEDAEQRKERSAAFETQAWESRMRMWQRGAVPTTPADAQLRDLDMLRWREEGSPVL